MTSGAKQSDQLNRLVFANGLVVFVPPTDRVERDRVERNRMQRPGVKAALLNLA